MPVLGRCPSCRESNDMTEERQGPTLGFCFREVSFLQSTESNTAEERQGPILGYRFREVSVLSQILQLENGRDQMQL